MNMGPNYRSCYTTDLLHLCNLITILVIVPEKSVSAESGQLNIE